jgi:hypothetical protein
MKKIYLLALALVGASGMFAQRNVATSPARRNFTREEISAMEARRQEVHSGIASAMRNELLNENFNGVGGSVPAALPSGWSTVQVTDLDDELVNAFRVHTSQSANNGGYWPVPQTTTGNRFAGANDDGSPCDCNMEDVWLQSPELDFSSASNIAVTFDIYHDQGFGGGDARLQVSTDGGTTFTNIQIGIDENGDIVDVLPVDGEFWQTVIIPVDNLSGEPSVIFRWQWSDDSEWASGFAVDNIVVGELPENDLKVDKLKTGNWNQDTFGFGFWDYSIVPVTQVSEVKATAVVFNKGFADQPNTQVDFAVLQDGTPVSGSPFTSDQISASLLSLDKDTLSVTTTFIPSELGTYTINATVSSEATEDFPDDNSATTSFVVDPSVYARDHGAAQAFVSPTTGDFEFGNLFDVYETEAWGGILVAIGAGSSVGNVIKGRLYEFTGLSETGPELSDLEIETLEYEIQSSDLNSVGEGDFVFLPFADSDEPSSITLEGGKVYLATVVCESGTRIPVSGGNEWVVSWLLDSDGWSATGSIPMVRMSADEALSIYNRPESVLSMGQNVPNPAQDYTMINYSLKQPERVTLTVRDLSGRVVSVQDEGLRMAGRQFIRLDVNNLSAGMYTYTITAGGVSLTKEMMVR